MPSLQKERNYQDLTLNVLSILEDEVPRTGRNNPHTDKVAIVFPTPAPLPAMSLDPPSSPPLSSVNCADTPIPTKAPVAKKKKVRKWVNLWSQHCTGDRARGQFRNPDDCHSYIDCWDGHGRKRHCYPRSLVFNEATGQCDWASSTPCILGDINQQEEDGGKKEIDLDQPNCSSYTGLGYKCVNFWECNQTNEIMDDPAAFYGEDAINARMVPPKRKYVPEGVFDPLSKLCPGSFHVCCKGKCSGTRKAKSLPDAHPNRVLANGEASILCPSGYTGNRPVPGICSQFAECHKGRAIIKDCPPGLHFCIHSLMCDWPEKIVCDQLDLLKSFKNGNKQTQNDEPRDSAKDYSSPLDLTMMARKTRVIPAPPSGQTVRLREGRTPSEGYLQLFSNDKWGYVCDKSGWTLTEAEIVCKQLGFSRGVRKTTQGFIHGSVDESRKLTEHVECSGSEGGIQNCRISFSEYGEPCKLAEDIVSISCIPESWATCNANEIPWKSSCYSFFPNASRFHAAQDHCKSQGKALLEIESQEENDMISELLFQNSKVTDVMNEVWTGGVGSNVARKNVWFWHSDTDKPMEFRNFWKGWSGGERSAAEIKDNFAYGIKMSRKYPIRKGQQKQNQLTDYYFWNLDNFDSKLSYICERKQNNIGCIVEEGAEYSGNATRTVSGAFCKPWNSPEIGFWFDQAQIKKLEPLESNHYCRNPDDAEAPWCLTNEGEYEDCDIPECNQGVKASFNHEKSTCASDQFECRPGECIFSGYVCDGEFDCSNKKDENPVAQCDKYMDQFKAVPRVKLDVEGIERWTNRNIEACLRSCVLSKDFVCTGVNMDKDTCILLEENVGQSGALVEDRNWVYYERQETQTLCAEEFRCESGKCFNETQMCDGKFDCPDRKDEDGCHERPNVQIRLVGGDSPNEGRIEIKAFDFDWGGICDDGFGVTDANVVCREAGFPLGAKEAVLHSRFGSGNEILLDEVNCKGSENTILECKFNPWKEHDCSAKEYAGVVCKQEQESCTDEEWKCKSGECINLEFLCDTTNDCSDGSDEANDICNKEVQIRLADGNNFTSGRVEVRYRGVWGTVCDDNFDPEEGKVVCRMLGFPGGVRIHHEATFGPGKGPIWINNILCLGNETSLENCPSPAWGPSYQCKHLEDVGIECLLNSYQAIDVRSGHDSPEGNDSFQCGVAEVKAKPRQAVAKVAGGQTAVHGAQPWTASIRVRGNTRSFHWCGAILITEKHFLTAAHCVEDYPKDVYAVRVGDWDQDVEDIGEQEFSIQKVNFHPEFNIGAYLNNDIAVVTIKTQGGQGVVFNNKVNPVCLPQSNTAYNPGLECTISGWGSLGQSSGGYSRRLQSATVPILPTTECMKKHVYGPEKLTGGMFCAGYLEGGVDSCQGDSGGPMVCQRREKSELLGIISWGYGCGRPNKPGVYTRVANYIDWIQEIIDN